MPTHYVRLRALATLLCGSSLLLACGPERPEEASNAFVRQIDLESSTATSADAGTGDANADGHQDLVVRNRAGMQLMVDEENTQPTLRIVLPGHPTSDRSIEVIFPEHVTVRKRGTTDASQLYLWQPGQFGERPAWRRSDRSLEYERSLSGGVQMLARATLDEDGVRFQFRFRNRSDLAYEMIYAPIDPRLTSELHDVRLERTYVHHADGFDLLASETPSRLTMPLDQWLPARYLASFTWPVPKQHVERRDDITYYNKSRAVDAPFIATLSQDRRWVVASFTRTTGNVWSNPELTCQHVDPQAALSLGEEATLETKILVVRGSLDAVFETAMRQRNSLEVRVEQVRDSVRGTVLLEGTAEAPVANLVTKDARTLSLTGPLGIDLLRQLEGLEIVAYAKRRRRVDEPVAMETFSVRGRGNDSARDGILRRTRNGDILELADGRRLAIPNLPEHLARADGKRIWISGSLEAPIAAGVIDPDRRFGRRRVIPEVRQ